MLMGCLQHYLVDVFDSSPLRYWCLSTRLEPHLDWHRRRPMPHSFHANNTLQFEGNIAPISCLFILVVRSSIKTVKSNYCSWKVKVVARLRRKT